MERKIMAGKEQKIKTWIDKELSNFEGLIRNPIFFEGLIMNCPMTHWRVDTVNLKCRDP
jgi:hypothetical protein